jgi:hypothetical protein
MADHVAVQGDGYAAVAKVGSSSTWRIVWRGQGSFDCSAQDDSGLVMLLGLGYH